jgi:hypothetical protein
VSCPYPTVRFVAYEDRKTWSRVFVQDPVMRGRYILTHRCVALAACPQCRSMVNEPCKGRQREYTSSAHIARMHAARFRRGEPVSDVTDVPENFDWEAFCT